MPIVYAPQASPAPERSLAGALYHGFLGRCPACRRGCLFRAFLKVADRCPDCGTELHHQRADDAPPYFVILILGHIIVPLALWVEMASAPPMWVHAAIWLPLSVGLALVLLPRVKGAIVGLQWALGMHGFGASLAADRLKAYGAPADAGQPGP
jgi:uncharacterized protein (DUF983 family)